MIAAGDDEFHIRKVIGNLPEGVNHQLQFFVRAPFSECQNAVRIPASREVGIFWTVREDAMGPHMDVVATVVFRKYFLVTRHEDGYGIGEQQHSSRNCARQSISARKTNAKIF